MQTFDKVITYPYGTNAFKVCESELLTRICKTINNKSMINTNDKYK